MKKTLDTIQKLSKAGYIISKIVMFCSIIGAGGCLLGIACLAIFGNDALQIGGLNIRGLIVQEAEMSMEQMYIAMAMAIVITIGGAIIAGFAARYFENELAQGTPFTLDGAAELRRLGLIAIFVSIGAQGLAAIVGTAMENMLGCEMNPNTDFGTESAITMGVFLLVASLIFKYGAELTGAAPSDEALLEDKQG